MQPFVPVSANNWQHHAVSVERLPNTHRPKFNKQIRSLSLYSSVFLVKAKRGSEYVALAKQNTATGKEQDVVVKKKKRDLGAKRHSCETEKEKFCCIIPLLNFKRLQTPFFRFFH